MFFFHLAQHFLHVSCTFYLFVQRMKSLKFHKFAEVCDTPSHQFAESVGAWRKNKPLLLNYQADLGLPAA